LIDGLIVQVSGGCVIEAGNEVGGDQSVEISRLKQQVNTSQPELLSTFFPKYFYLKRIII